MVRGYVAFVRYAGFWLAWGGLALRYAPGNPPPKPLGRRATQGQRYPARSTAGRGAYFVACRRASPRCGSWLPVAPCGPPGRLFPAHRARGAAARPALRSRSARPLGSLFPAPTRFFYCTIRVPIVKDEPGHTNGQNHPYGAACGSP